MIFASGDGNGVFWFLVLMGLIGIVLKSTYRKFDKDGTVHEAAKEGIIWQLNKWLKK